MNRNLFFHLRRHRYLFILNLNYYYTMEKQILLDKLILMSETERLDKIIKNADSILNDDFITFMRGQIEFAERIENGARYFDRIYFGEDASLLRFLKKEMEHHAVQVDITWKTIQKAIHYFDEKLLLETSMKTALEGHVLALSNEANPCNMCSELTNSHGLCNGCLKTGKPPASIQQHKEKKVNKQDVNTNTWNKKDNIRMKRHIS